MKHFKLDHLFFDTDPEYFTELTSPKWLSEGGIKGSTMDGRWFGTVIL